MNGVETMSDLSNSTTVVSSFTCSTYLDTQPSYITDIKLLPTGDILLIDADNQSAKVFKTSGKLIFEFGNTVMERPDKAVVIQSHKTFKYKILISDLVAECIFTFDKYGIPLSRFPSPDNGPSALAVTHEGNILVTDWKTGDAHVVTKKGGNVLTFLTDLQWPVYAAASINGNIIISDWKSNAIKIFDCSGRLLHTYGSGLKEDDQNKQAGIDTITMPEKAGIDSITMPEKAGIDNITMPEKSGIDSITMPNGTVCDTQGNIFITDMGNQRIHVLSQDRSFQGVVATRKHGIIKPTGIAMNTDREIIVSNLDGEVVILSLPQLKSTDCKMTII